MNNPLRYVDPDGRNPWEIVSKIVNKYITNKSISESIAERKQEEARMVAIEIGGIHNGKADAWRHASWSKESSEAVGKGWTALFGIGHEIENLLEAPIKDLPNTVSEIMMDLTNNALGRESAGSNTNLKELASENKLRTLDSDNSTGYEYSKDNVQYNSNKSKGFSNPDAERIRKSMYEDDK